jgi:pilus assembly protein CpaE
MPDKNGPIPIVVITEPGPLQEQVQAALDAQSEFQLITNLETADGLMEAIRSADPEIILVDHKVDEKPTLDLLDDLSLQFPGLAMVAIIPVNNPELAQQATLAGAHAFLIQPFTQTQMLNTLRRVHQLESRRRQAQAYAVTEETEEEEPLQIVSVFSPRGGVGCSSLAINLALAFREMIADRVLLFDGKLMFGHLGLMLNIRAHNDVTDLIPHASTLDESLIKDVVTEHNAGIDVLLSPDDVQIAQGIRPGELYNVMRAVRRSYDFIVIDAGSSLNENTVTLMDLSDKIILVTTPDLAALQDTSRFIQVSRTLAYPPGKVLVVLNRAGMPGGVRSKDIESALNHELFAEIPEEGSKVLRSLNRGIPLMFRYPRNPVSRAIKDLATSLAEIGLDQREKSFAKAASLPAKLQDRISAFRSS